MTSGPLITAGRRQKVFRGNRQSRVTPSRRVQGFDPEVEPNRRGQESGTRNCRNGIKDQISKPGPIEARQSVGPNREGPQQRTWKTAIPIPASGRLSYWADGWRRDERLKRG